MLPDDRPARLPAARRGRRTSRPTSGSCKQKLTKLSGIGSIESSFALEQVKYTNVLPLA